MTSAVAAVVGDGGEAKVTVRLGAMSGVELVTRPPPAIAGDVAVDEAIAIVGDVHTSLANLSTKRIGSGRVIRLNLGKKKQTLTAAGRGALGLSADRVSESNPALATWSVTVGCRRRRPSRGC